MALLQRTTGVQQIVLHRAELDRASRRRWRAARARFRVAAVLGPRRRAGAAHAAWRPTYPGAAERDRNETLLGTPLVPLAANAAPPTS